MLYQNLGILSDRIILKIEALFEIDCDDCKETYRNKLGDTPPLHCRLCLQGSHSCEAIQKKLEGYKPIVDAGDTPTGIVWLCHECLKKNHLDVLRPTNNKEKPNEVEKEGEEEEEEEKAGEEEEEEEEEERVSPRRGREGQEDRPRNPLAPKDTRPNAGKDNICEDYKRRKCLHGRTGELLVNGERCSKNHPPRCRRFCNFGPNNREGCKSKSALLSTLHMYKTCEGIEKTFPPIPR